MVYESGGENIKIYADGAVTFEKQNLTVLKENYFHENLLSFITVGRYHRARKLASINSVIMIIASLTLLFLLTY